MVQQRDGGRGRGRRRDRDEPQDDIIEKVVSVSRVAKVVKGGRRFSFTSVVVVGDGNGRVGIGIGRANEVPDAIRKGSTIARRDMITVPIRNGTIPHPITAQFCASKVLLKPAAPGTGVIAGGGVRAVLEAVGLRNVLSKSLGSNNVVNVVQATRRALTELRDPVQVRRERLRLAGRLPDEPAPEPTEPADTEAELATAGASE
ncbi:MAG: 30S ribosomal protein S5 [Chloroflexi bacterium]|nr:30S ribosomal protein S5 [Chloroflexota bacterium]